MRNQANSKKEIWTILKLLNWASSYFKSRHIEGPRSSAEILLAYVLKINRIDLYLKYDQPLLENELKKFKDCLKRRANREPVAYITGIREFWSMDLAVNRNVLIPRPETECLVEKAVSILRENEGTGRLPYSKRVLELGTGSGAVILALVSQLHNTEHLFFASDKSPKALETAIFNSNRHTPGQICFFAGDWFAPLKDNPLLFSLIVSNPPYISTGEIRNLQPEISRFEPSAALDGGKDGLKSIKQIIEKAHFFLRDTGSLILEIGHDQKNEIQKIIDQCGRYENVIFHKDYGGHDRVVEMKKK